MSGLPSAGEQIEDQEQFLELLKDAREGDKEARDRLVQANLGLVHKVLQRFRNRGYDYEDLFQVGSVGLIKAVENFDPERGVKFSSYAVPMIMGEVKRFLRDDQRMRVSRRVRQRAKKIIKKKEELENALGKEPTISQLAEALDMEREKIVYALEAVRPMLSLEKPVYENEGNSVRLREMVASEKGPVPPEMRLDLSETLGELEERERKIIQLRYFAEKTQAEIGEELGLSQVQISRLERQILEKIKSRLESTES